MQPSVDQIIQNVLQDLTKPRGFVRMKDGLIGDSRINT